MAKSKEEGYLSSGLVAQSRASFTHFRDRSTPHNTGIVNFPSNAGVHDRIKLPRQRRVDSEEYKQFLNLGMGGIFELDLEKVLVRDRIWLNPMVDSSEFFNYDHTLATWHTFCQRVKSFRLEVIHSLSVEKEELESRRQNEGMMTVQSKGDWTYQEKAPVFVGGFCHRNIDCRVQLVLVEGTTRIGAGNWLALEEIRHAEKCRFTWCSTALKARKKLTVVRKHNELFCTK